MIMIIGSVLNKQPENIFSETNLKIEDIVKSNNKFTRLSVISNFFFAKTDYSKYIQNLYLGKIIFYIILLIYSIIIYFCKESSETIKNRLTYSFVFFCVAYITYRWIFVSNKKEDEMKLLNEHCVYIVSKFFNSFDYRFCPETTIAREFLDINDKFASLSDLIINIFSFFFNFISIIFSIFALMYFLKVCTPAIQAETERYEAEIQKIEELFAYNIMQKKQALTGANFQHKMIMIGIQLPKFLFYSFIIINSFTLLTILLLFLNCSISSPDIKSNRLNSEDIISMLFLLKNRETFVNNLTKDYCDKKQYAFSEIFLSSLYKLFNFFITFFRLISVTYVILLPYGLVALLIYTAYLFLMNDQDYQAILEMLKASFLMSPNIYYLIIWSYLICFTYVGDFYGSDIEKGNLVINILTIYFVLLNKPIFEENNIVLLKNSDKIISIIAKDASVYHYNKKYGFFQILNNINLELDESTFILGRSGIGKTTLLNAIYKSVASKGIYFKVLDKDGKTKIIPINKIKKSSIDSRIKYGKQLLNYPVPTMTIKEVIKNVYFIEDEQALKIINNILTICGIINPLDTSFYQRQVGIQGSGLLYREQRIFSLAVSIAQAVSDPSTNIIFGDEVLDYLNKTQKDKIMEYLKKYLFLIIEHRITKGKQILTIKSQNEFIIEGGEKNVA